MARHLKAFDADGLTRLERMRRLYGWSLDQMAALTDIPRTTLARILKGQTPDVYMAIRLARVFRVTVEQLWGDLSNPKQALTDS